MMPFPGSAMMYRAATGLERSLADVDAERIFGIDAEEIISTWDPYLTYRRNLPYLAWAMGAQIWEPDWSEGTAREWTALQWTWKSLIGTEAGIAMALDYVGRDHIAGSARTGYLLKQVVAPPQGFYASPDLTKEEYDAWIHLMPELRFKFATGKGLAGLGEIFASDGFDEDSGFADDGWVGLDDGPILYGRRVVLRRNGIDTPLQTPVREDIQWQGRTLTVERVSLPGTSEFGIFANDWVMGEDRFVGQESPEARLVTLALDGSYMHERSFLSLTTAFPTLDPINPRFERDSDIGIAGPFMFADDVFIGSEGAASGGAGASFTGEDLAADMLADRIFLNDPHVAAPMSNGWSFAGIDRVGMSPYHAELLVDLRTVEPGPAWMAGEGFEDEGFAVPEDGSHIDRALKAVVASKALRDKIIVSFRVKRPLAPSDHVHEDTLSGAWVPASL
jgi:hypothetical protein